MTTYRNFDDFLQRFKQKAQHVVPNLVAETAVEYFMDRFKTKEWDGQPWPQTKRFIKNGDLLRRGGHLMKSIKPAMVTPQRVRISAGNGKVPYARIHNEGGVLHPNVTPQMRKWAWANYYQQAGKGVTTNTRTGRTYQRWNPGVSENVNFYKAIALTKKQKLDITIPRRKYMGHSPRLNQAIKTRIVNALRNM